MVLSTAYIIYTLLGSLFLTSESLGLTTRVPHNSITDVLIAVCVVVYEGVRPRVILPAPSESCGLVLPISAGSSA